MSFEMNKIAGALLGAMILAMVSGIIAHMLVHVRPLEKPAYIVAGAEPTRADGRRPEGGAGPEPIGPLLASASADAGKEQSKNCAACHTFEKGGAEPDRPESLRRPRRADRRGPQRLPVLGGAERA